MNKNKIIIKTFCEKWSGWREIGLKWHAPNSLALNPVNSLSEIVQKVGTVHCHYGQCLASSCVVALQLCSGPGWPWP